MAVRQKRNKVIGFFITLVLLLLIVGVVLIALHFLDPKDRSASAEQENAIVQLQEQITELNENVNTLLVVVEEKEHQISYMTFALYEAEDELKEKNTALITLSNEVTRKNGEIDKLTAENTKLQTELDELKANSEMNAQKIAELEEKVNNNATKIANLKTEIENTKLTISQIQTKVSEIENSIKDTTTKISKIETDITNIDSEIKNIETKIDSLNSSIQMLMLGSITEIHIAQTNKYETSYVVFGNGLCLQWAFNNCSSKGVINQKLAKVYTTTTYLVMLTPATLPTSTTVWGARVNTAYTDHFVGYLTNRTSGSNSYSGGGGYYWFTIGQIAV